MMYLWNPKSQIYFPENILTEKNNEYTFFLKKELLEILWSKVNMYPLYLIESYYNNLIDEKLKWIFNLEEKVKELFDKDNIVFLLNYYKDGKNYYYLFIWTDISSKENNFLNRYNINETDLNFVNWTIKETQDKHSILIFKEGNFISFNGIWHYWLSPIEYYLKWKNEMEWKEIFNKELLKWPYDYISKRITSDLKKELNTLWYKEFYISNKEKFWSWRYEKSYVIKKEISVFKRIYNFFGFKNNYNQYISISEISNLDIFYKIYYLFDKYMSEYRDLNPLTSFDYEEEWKNSFWIKI